MISKQNQQNPLLPKKKRVDSLGNSRKRVFVKSGTATLLLASGLTKNAADIFVQSVKDNAQRLGGKIECNFFLAQ